MKKVYVLLISICVLGCNKSDNNPNNTNNAPTLLNVLWNSSTSNMPYCTSTSWVSSPGFSIEIFSNDTYNENTVQHGTWYWLTNPTELILVPSKAYQTDSWAEQMFITNLTSTTMTMTNNGGCSYTFTK